jgi:hypothetical protein
VHSEDCEENEDGDECGPEGECREEAELARRGQVEYCSALTGWANVCRTYRRWILVDADGASPVIFNSFEGKQK